MRIFVLTATYELRVSRKSHLRDHPTVVPRYSPDPHIGWIGVHVRRHCSQVNYVFGHHPGELAGCLARDHNSKLLVVSAKPRDTRCFTFVYSLPEKSQDQWHTF